MWEREDIKSNTQSKKEKKIWAFNLPDMGRVLTEFPSSRSFTYMYSSNWDAFAVLCVHHVCALGPLPLSLLYFSIRERWKIPKNLPGAWLQENKTCICKNVLCFFTWGLHGQAKQPRASCTFITLHTEPLQGWAWSARQAGNRFHIWGFHRV